MSALLPLFLRLEGRRVLVVGGGVMAVLGVRQFSHAGARSASARAPRSRGPSSSAGAQATPAAVLLGASTPDAFSRIGTLAELGSAALPERNGAPGTLVIGAVAALGRASRAAGEGARSAAGGS